VCIFDGSQGGSQALDVDRRIGDHPFKKLHGLEKPQINQRSSKFVCDEYRHLPVVKVSEGHGCGNSSGRPDCRSTEVDATSSMTAASGFAAPGVMLSGAANFGAEAWADCPFVDGVAKLTPSPSSGMQLHKTS